MDMDEIELDPQHVKNLTKLAEYLEGLPKDYKHFEMKYFFNHMGSCGKRVTAKGFARRPEAALDNCGTVACALGHGPAAGVRLEPDDFDLDDADTPTHGVRWNRYSRRAMGVDGHTPEWEFLFGADWHLYDNHHHGAAARIRYLLDRRRVPEAFGNRYGFGSGRYGNSRRSYAPYRLGSRSATRKAIEAANA